MTDVIEPLADPIPVAAARLGISRSLLYILIRDKSIVALKARGRTLISRTEQSRWLNSLPSATA